MDNHNTHHPALTVVLTIASGILAWFTDIMHLVSLHAETIKSADMVLSILTKTGSFVLIIISVCIYIYKGIVFIKKKRDEN